MATFDSTKNALPKILEAIVQGKIQLPDFQRGWVWDDEHIRSLLVSLARAFPVGAVMLLETGGEAKFKIRPVEGLDPALILPQVAEQLILDGQQRLTSLTQMLMLNSPVKTRDDKKRPMERYYYINIERALEGSSSYEDAIVSIESNKTKKTNFGRDIVLDLRTPEKEFENFHFPCNQILNSDEWEERLNTYDPSKFLRKEAFFSKHDLPYRTQLVPLAAILTHLGDRWLETHNRTGIRVQKSRR